MPGAPYDGHTLHSQLEQVEILTGVKPGLALADRGYRGVPPPAGIRLLISHTRGLPAALKKLLKRRQAIEPTIGHMKTDGLLARNSGQLQDRKPCPGRSEQLSGRVKRRLARSSVCCRAACRAALPDPEPTTAVPISPP